MPHGLGIVGAGRERRGSDDGLEGGARLVDVHHRPVFELRRRGFVEMVRVIGGLICQRQDVPGLRIHDNQNATGGVGSFHSPVQGALGVELDILINGKIDGPLLLRFERRHGRFQYRISSSIGQNALANRTAANEVVQRHFQPVQPLVVNAHKAQHIGGHGAIGIEAATLFHESKPLPFLLLQERFHLRRIFGLHGALQPYETSIPQECFLDFLFLHVKQRRQSLCRLRRRHIEHPRVRIERLHHDGECHFLPVAVVNRAARRVERLHAFGLVQRHVPVVIPFHDLHPEKTQHKKKPDGGHNGGHPKAATMHPSARIFCLHARSFH